MLLKLATYTAALLIPFAVAQTGCTPANRNAVPPVPADNSICTRGRSSAGETGSCIQTSGRIGRCAYRLNDCYEGFYSVPGAFTAGQNAYNDCQACPAGTSSPAKSPTVDSCAACTKGSYSTGMGGKCTLCPLGSTTAGPGSTMMSQCNVCDPGYEPNHDMTGCDKCLANEYGPGGTSMCLPCDKSKGEYSEPGAATCKKCTYPNQLNDQQQCVPCTAMVSNTVVCMRKKRRSGIDTPW